MPPDNLGEPLTDAYSIPGGQARLFERGVTIDGARGEAVAAFAFPMIGRPVIVTGDPAAQPISESHAIRFVQGPWELETLVSLILGALAGRLSLLPTGQPGTPVPLNIGPATVMDADIYGFPVTAASLQERQLYDVALLDGSNQWRVVAPHAVYHRRTWRDFGIAHITDVHVARRIDKFREVLVQAGRHAGAKRLNNWNDRFRGFVRYANYLHAIGMLDLVLSTGDQYDYIYEDDDDHALGGNAAFMRRLVLGQAPGPDFSDVEELHVPIFMIPGNHDYRKHPYKLVFDLHVDTDVLGPTLGTDVMRVLNYSGYNLPYADAKVLAARLDGLPDFLGLPGMPVVANVSPDGAARMIDVDKEIKAYKQFLSDRTFYVVRLGDHRIVMLDSGHDVGMLTSVWDALRHLLGATTEDEDTFGDGSPNSEGVSPQELAIAASALAETPDDALFIVGLHAPLINPVNDEWPYFLRESQRPAQTDQATKFVARHDQVGVIDRSSVEKEMKARHPTWFVAGEGHVRPPDFVKRVSSQDMLDFAVSRGRADELIRLLTGIGSPRPGDIVLSGHTHYHNEVSVRKIGDDEIAFHLDFYTQNPVNYYPTRFSQGWMTLPAATPARYLPTTEKTYVEVLPEAASDAAPVGVRDRALKHDIKVPPYANPLDATADPRAWWSEHRPLLMQTGSYAPFKVVSFLSGFRLLSVRSNVIEKIYFFSTARLEANNYRLAWEDAVLPDQPGPPAPTWESVSEGIATPGGHVAAVAAGDDRVAVFAADPGGAIYTTMADNRVGWRPWTSVSEGRSTPGAPVGAVRTGDRITLFVADPDGGIYATSGNYPQGWRPWRSVSEGHTTPGAHVSGVVAGGRVTLFVADPNGGVYATSGSYDDGWGPWRSVSEGSSSPGAPVTAVATGDRVTVFVADPGGGVYVTSGKYGAGWSPWRSVSEGSTVPGAHVAAVTADGNRITVFVSDPAGGIYATSGSYLGGWGPWKSVSEGVTSRGGHVTAVAANGSVTLFIVDPNGGVFSTSGRYPDGWLPWISVSEGSSTPGAPVSAVVVEDRIRLFLADPNGGIYTRSVALG